MIGWFLVGFCAVAAVVLVVGLAFTGADLLRMLTGGLR
jgi:hypothetical protein